MERDNLRDRTVVIDCFPSSISQYKDGYAVVAIDVIRATTTAVTAAAAGRRCFPVASIEEAFVLRNQLANALLIGELGGVIPAGFDMNNSPAELALRDDCYRPAILLSSSGTKLLSLGRDCDAVYVACFRNYESVAMHLAHRHAKIAIIGAGTREEFREEDQMCCAWIAEALLKAGYKAQDDNTSALVQRWSGAPLDACTTGNSAAYLRRSGQLRDLEFILEHVNDLPAFAIIDGEVVLATRTTANVALAA